MWLLIIATCATLETGGDTCQTKTIPTYFETEEACDAAMWQGVNLILSRESDKSAGPLRWFNYHCFDTTSAES